MHSGVRPLVRVAARLEGDRRFPRTPREDYRHEVRNPEHNSRRSESPRNGTNIYDSGSDDQITEGECDLGLEVGQIAGSVSAVRVSNKEGEVQQESPALMDTKSISRKTDSKAHDTC